MHPDKKFRLPISEEICFLALFFCSSEFKVNDLFFLFRYLVTDEVEGLNQLHSFQFFLKY